MEEKTRKGRERKGKERKGKERKEGSGVIFPATDLRRQTAAGDSSRGSEEEMWQQRTDGSISPTARGHVTHSLFGKYQPTISPIAPACLPSFVRSFVIIFSTKPLFVTD